MLKYMDTITGTIFKNNSDYIIIAFVQVLMIKYIVIKTRSNI